MRLLRAEADTGVFQELEAQWRGQCEELNELYDEFAGPSLDHARRVASDPLRKETYAIYALQDSTGEYVCLSHINVARLPGTAGRTLRVVWVLMAPRYDYEEIAPDTMAQLVAGLFELVIDLASGGQDERMAAEHIKIHLTGLGDRRFFGPAVQHLKSSEILQDVETRGNWLHLSLNEYLGQIALQSA